MQHSITVGISLKKLNHFFLSAISSSAKVTVKKEKLNWAEANEDCQLINVSQLRSVYKTLTSELIVREEYWIKDSVEEISVLIKGES